MGADILGTVKRLNWFSFTYGKKKSTTSTQSSEKPESISIDGAPRIFQKTAKHNLGKSSAKDHELTHTAFRNGYSKSAIGMTISSDPQYTNFVDLTISSAKHAKMYFKEEKTKKEAIMSAFSLIAGSDPYDSEEDEGNDFFIHTG